METEETVGCPVCGLLYRKFRAHGLSFEETYWMLRAEHDQRIREEADHSQPPRRARILGKMHQHKKEAWDEHLRYCELVREEASQ